jgi:hypothetical protein
VSGGGHRWFKRSTRKKGRLTRDSNDDDNNNNNNNAIAIVIIIIIIIIIPISEASENIAYVCGSSRC